jgi:DNA-directed RNA polymerase subunit RPC12/RpoP
VSKNVFALACKHCGWRPDPNLTMGVAAQHFETEHDTTEPRFELIVVCDRCDRVMTHLATIGEEHHYQCEPCRRGRVIHQREVPA